MVRNGTIMNQNTQSVSMTEPALICSQVNKQKSIVVDEKSYILPSTFINKTETRDMQQSIAGKSECWSLYSMLGKIRVQCTMNWTHHSDNSYLLCLAFQSVIYENREVYLENYLKNVTPKACMLAYKNFFGGTEAFLLVWWIRALWECRSIIHSLLCISIHIINLIPSWFLMMLVTSIYGEQRSKLQHQAHKDK